MLSKIPNSSHWVDHILQRFNEAKTEIGLIDSHAEVTTKDANVFIPDGADESAFEKSHPWDDNLRSAFRANEPLPIGWTPRETMYEEIGAWLDKNYSDGLHYLVSPLEFNDINDKALRGLPHIVYQDKPFLYANLKGAASHTNKKSIVGWSHSWRTIAAIVPATVTNEIFKPTLSGLFVCDAYSHDSWIIAPFYTK